MTGDRFAAIRKELGLTQPQLCEITGGKKSIVSDYENGRRNIPYKLALALEALAELHRLGGDIHAASKRAKAE